MKEIMVMVAVVIVDVAINVVENAIIIVINMLTIIMTAKRKIKREKKEKDDGPRNLSKGYATDVV